MVQFFAMMRWFSGYDELPFLTMDNKTMLFVFVRDSVTIVTKDWIGIEDIQYIFQLV